MTTSSEKPRDLVGGILVMAAGLGFLALGRDLEMGTSFRMGPGYFPTILSGLLVLLGAALTVAGVRAPRTLEGAGRLPWRGLLLIIGAVAIFGATLRGLGLMPALAVVVLATAWASRYATWKASLPLAIGLTLFCVLLFIKGLSLPLPLVGPWLKPAPASEAPKPA